MDDRDKTFFEIADEWRMSLNPSYCEVYLGILDIMGFSAYLKEECQNSPKNLTQYIGEEIASHKITVNDPKYPSYQTLHLKMLSDTFIVYSKDRTPASLLNIIFALEGIRIGMIKKGFFTRGAIVQGKHYINNDILISPAFLDAHEIEQCECKKPRIIINGELADSLTREYKQENGINGIFENDEFRPISKETISRDCDEKYVVRPFFDISSFAKYMQDDFTSDQYFYKDIDTYDCDAVKRIRDGILCGKKRAGNCEKHQAKAAYLVKEFNQFIDNLRIFENEKQNLKID